MRWYEYKMEVDDLTAPDDLKAKLLAMTDTLTAEEKAEPMMAAPAPQTAAPLNTETKKKKPIHFPVKQLGTLAACLAVWWTSRPCSRPTRALSRRWTS